VSRTHNRARQSPGRLVPVVAQLAQQRPIRRAARHFVFQFNNFVPTPGKQRTTSNRFVQQNMTRAATLRRR
jgi:hypothetical protein